MPNPNSPYLSVTQVIGAAGLGRYSNSDIPESVLNTAGERGTRIHEACSKLLMGHGEAQATDDLHTNDFLYWDGFMRAVKEKGLEEPWFSNYSMESHLLMLNGELDEFLPTNEGPVLMDIKTGTPHGKHPNNRRYEFHPAVGLQTAAYRMLARVDEEIGKSGVLEEFWECKRRALYLLKDGTYRWIHLDNDDDEYNFTAALRVVNMRRRFEL